MYLVAKLYKNLLDLVLPKYCLSCFQIGNYLCASCVSSELTYFDNECHVCRKSVKDSYYVHSICKQDSSLDGVFVLYRYNNLIKKLIGEFKYNGYFSISETIVDLILSYALFPDTDIVTSVPLYNQKKLIRGFNQSELIARSISDILSVEYREILIRKKNTKAQMKLSKKERLNNLEGAFKINNYKLKGKSLLIVDDIMTTGTTLESCGRLLKLNGAKKVFSLVISRR